MINEIDKLINDKYEELSINEKEELYKLLKDKNTRKELKSKVESILFRVKPPTPEEFLSPESGWMSKKVCESIFPYIKEEFINILKGDENGDPYNKVVQYGSTRRGKSFLAHLLILYIIVFFHCLRDPNRFWGLSPNSEMCIYLVSFKYDKIKEVYLSPLYKILSNSKKFIKVMRADQVITTQEKVGLDKIVWSKSATSGFLTLQSGLQLQLGNDEALSYLGANTLTCFISEISFFCLYAGATEEKIYKLYTDISSRIQNTVKNGYLGFTYLDSSAHRKDSLIEAHIINELSHREKTYFSWKSRWEALPSLYPKWQKTGQTFKVITGNADIPAKIVESDNDLINVSKDLIVDVPIDLKQLFQDDLIGEIRNSAGRPTSNENKFINDSKHINNLFNNDSLKNIEGILIADAKEFPEELLWTKLENTFFTKNASGKYMFRRAPEECRYFGWDSAYSAKGDIMGVACIHKEWDNINNKIMYVTDFTFAIGPNDTGINLAAVPKLLLDIKIKCNAYIFGLYTDTFQSQSQIQELERFQIQTYKQSVDSSLTPYITYLTHLVNESIKCGKNIFLKNNLMCLTRIKNKNREKVDHPIGSTNNRYNGDFDKSECGINAKDVSDAHCQAFFGAYSHNYTPTTIYQIEQKKFSTNMQDIKDLSKDAYKKLHKFY
jgi:hypothetical protein